MGRKLSRNAPCPCGSGKAYKQCCLRKGIEWRLDGAGQPVQSVPLDDETRDALQTHIGELEDAKGAPLDPDDLLFPELADLSEEELLGRLAQRLREAGVDPAFVYAFERTGLLVTDANWDRIPEVDREAWMQAVQEYRDRQN